MGKFIKGLLQKELETTLSDNKVKEFMVISLSGVSGVNNNMLRGSLKKKGIRLTIVKNSIVKRALGNQKLEKAEDLFTGTCAIAYGGDSVVDVAREIVDWAKKVPAITIKGAYLDGTTLDATVAADLSKMPSRPELQGSIVGLMMSPARKIASAITSPASAIAGCLKTIIENGEKSAA